MGETQSVLLVSLPFAGIDIPSIQLGVLESYLKQRNIRTNSKHLYVNAADIYGIQHYNFLIYPPNDSYTAQLFFIKHVFPDHYKENKAEIKWYFQEKISKNTSEKQYNLDYEQYQKRTDSFFQYVNNTLNWKDYDIIGFTCNYGQFLPSLAVAKQIKKQNPKKHIVFGGSRTSGTLGKASLQSFDYIDTIVSGEGEEALYQLCLSPSTYEHISNLIYRKDSTIKTNPSIQTVNLSDSPIPSYDSFYHTLLQCSAETQQYHQYYGRLPVEISRGCWWNKCSFCNLNLQYDHYKEKAYENITKEITTLTETYGLLTIQLIGNTLPIKDLSQFLSSLQQINKDCTFIAEARADQLTRENYNALKKAGISIMQTGIESFSTQYLQKMKKGVSVIENIESLKNCQELGIENHYNLIIGYPNEDTTDFEETKYIVNIIQSYLDPPTLCTLRIVYDSPIQKNPGDYTIDDLKETPIDRLFFPDHILANHICFVYDYEPTKQNIESSWQQLIKTWRYERDQRKKDALKTKQEIDQFVFYFKDGGTFIKIFDKRKKDQIKISILDSFERRVFLSCLSISHYNNIVNQFSIDDEVKLKETLTLFVNRGIMYEENNNYLTLPLQYRLLKGMKQKSQTGEKQLFSQSIIQLKNQ